MVDVAEVFIWDELVGAVRWEKDRKLASFQYAPSFLNKGWDIAPVKMPLSGGDRIYRFPELRVKADQTLSTFNGLPGLLADSLPDKYGNELINSWLSRNGRPPNSMNPVEQLCFIGSRGMGALTFRPTMLSDRSRTSSLEIKSLIEVANKMLSGREKFSADLSEDEEKTMAQVLKIGTSAGGARPKAVIAYDPDKNIIRSGQTTLPEGFEHWMIKLDGVSENRFGESNGFGRVEYAYYLMALDCNIHITDCKLLEENGRAHFMTQRFDREKGDVRHHQQTFCGLRHFDYNNIYSYSYEQLFETMRMLRLTYPEAEQMFRRMVFNILATNCDDHTKNFSFLLKKDQKWELAPAYDLCFSYDPDNVWVNQQTLSVNGKHREITTDDMISLANAMNIKKSDKIISRIQEVIRQWEYYADVAKVSQQLKGHILSQLKAIH